MRIAYVALGVEQKNMVGGVGRKIRTQMRLWTEMGHESRLFALVPGYADAGTYAYAAGTRVPVLREASRGISRVRALSCLLADVRNYAPDIIYLRTGTYVYPVQILFGIGPVVIELNTNDIAETRLRGPAVYWYNLLTRGVILRKVAGVVAVTSEIAALGENRNYRKPSRVIGNGIDLSQYRPLPAPKNDRPAITLVGSSRQAWHGADKLTMLAERYPGLDVHIVGYSEADLPAPLPGNVLFHGFLDEEGVRQVLLRTDVACGSLALHRNRMQEGSSLKVREALAYGVPILLAYRDADLSGLQSDLILELPNSSENIREHAERIDLFAREMMGKRVPRALIADRIDQHPKERIRLAFFEELLGNLRGSRATHSGGPQ
jgi:glycosyltransferase involved in cell wall biosynthesis